jgi:tRNA(Leu) C34 or U34 (ribose-2'-O)-methylase TrmL
MILIEGQELFMKAAGDFSDKEPLIEIAEMHLFNLLEILLNLVDPSSHGDITFSQQLLKVALLQSMGTVLTVLKEIEFYEVKFFSPNHILAIFDLSLDKPVASMTAAQFDDWSELQISFVGAKWRLLGIVAGFFHHSTATAELVDLEETFERCLVALESAKYRAVPAILHCLEILLPLLMSKNRRIPVRLLKEALNIGRELMRSHFDAPKWLDVYAHAFISFFFQPCLITGEAIKDGALHGPEGIVREAFWYVLNDLGPIRKGLVAQLSYNLAQAWASQPGCRHAYIQEIAQLLLYGPIRDQAEAKHTSLATFSQHLGEVEEDEDEIGQDYMTRVHLITLLNHLDPTLDSDHEFAMALLGLFLDRALGIGIDAWEAKNVFPNAIQHRRRMRAWMATMILFKMMRESDFVGGLEAKLWDCLAKEAMPSTRAFIEWFIAKGYLAFPAQTPHLLLRLNDPAKPASFVISSLLISYHVAMHIPSGSSDLIKTLFGYICPIFAEPNFQLRTTAIWVFQKLWTRSKDQDSLPEAYQLTYQRIKDNENILKALVKLDAYPTHGRLDVIQDYNLDFIFYEFPLAIGIAVDELITHYAFRAASLTEGLVPITRRSPRPVDQLVSSSTSPLVAPPSGELAVTKAEEAEVEGLFKDFQQKISLWDLSLFEEELGDFRKTRELEKRKARLGETIVMASLIDKVPNLAGLSRTCEIFGVTRLTVPSAAVLQDPQFKAISMTSDKWLQIDPVKPEHIMAYVEARRAEGFRILAVEQTSLSVPLQNYSFPSKYLLILGNETSGVPPELLHLVDDCVEVPQFGMIRSLNVHVCGSIVVWESRKQLLSKMQAQI